MHRLPAQRRSCEPNPQRLQLGPPLAGQPGSTSWPTPNSPSQTCHPPAAAVARRHTATAAATIFPICLPVALVAALDPNAAAAAAAAAATPGLNSGRMADVDQRQGGPGSSRRKKHAAAKSKPKPQPSNDWPRTGEPRSRASPRSKRHGDIDIDIVESSDDANDARASSSKQAAPRQRPVRPSSIHSGTASDATAPAKAPQPSPTRRSKSMRVPKASVPVQDTPPVHRRPTCIVEEEDDDDDDSDDDDDDDNGEPSGPSRPHSRQTIARREISPRSAHPYRSTPESRRSPRTSVSDSEDETDATSDSDEEQVIQPRGKHLPPAPMAPAVPSAPPAVHPSLQERLSRRPEMVYEDEEGDGISRYAPSARHRSLSRPPSSRQDRYRRPRDIVVSGPPSLDETRRSRSRSKR